MPFKEKEYKKRLSVLDEFSNENSNYYTSEVSSNLSYNLKMGEHCSNKLDNFSLANFTKDNDSNKSSNSIITNKSVELLKPKESSTK